MKAVYLRVERRLPPSLLSVGSLPPCLAIIVVRPASSARSLARHPSLPMRSDECWVRTSAVGDKRRVVVLPRAGCHPPYQTLAASLPTSPSLSSGPPRLRGRSPAWPPSLPARSDKRWAHHYSRPRLCISENDNANKGLGLPRTQNAYSLCVFCQSQMFFV